MLHCQKLAQRKGFSLIEALKLKKGFSLIELLVVIAIIGVLAAVAIPAYNNYRDDAAKKALVVSVKNIGKAYLVCRADKGSIGSCTTLGQINVSCESCGTPSVSGDSWCVDAMNGTGAMDPKACLGVASSSSPPNVYKSWENSTCATHSVTYDCSGWSGTPGTTKTTPTVAASGSDLCTTFGCADGNTTDLCTSTANKSANCTGTTSTKNWNGVCTSGKCN